MLAIMVDIAVNGTSEAVRLAAADKVIDRAMGKAPAHIDITAMRHTDIVYQSAEEPRAEFRKALEAEGVPRALLDPTVEDELEEPSAKAHFCPGERRRAGRAPSAFTFAAGTESCSPLVPIRINQVDRSRTRKTSVLALVCCSRAREKNSRRNQDDSFAR